MRKKYTFAAMIILMMGLTACSLEPTEETPNPRAVTGAQTKNDGSAETGIMKTEDGTMETEMGPAKTEDETMKAETEPVGKEKEIRKTESVEIENEIGKTEPESVGTEDEIGKTTSELVGTENEIRKTESVKTEDGETKIPETESTGNDADFRQSIPIVGSVESYEDDIIAVKDSDTGSILYFSTREAEVIEGDVPITVGDIVEIVYRGAQGDKEYPGTAVKVVEFSMRQCTIVVCVENYENGIIAVRDMDTGIILYFSTQEAEVIEGETPIAAGDIVEVTYRGAEGDKEHPGIAVKVVAESMVSYFVP